MPKLVHLTPKYRHHKPSGQAVVTLNGRDFYLGKWRTAESKREYARLTAQYLEAGGALPDSTSETISVEELLNAFRIHAKSYYGDQDGKPSQEQINFNTLIRRLRIAYGSDRYAEGHGYFWLRIQPFRSILLSRRARRRRWRK